MGGDTAPCRTHQRLRDALAGRVVLEDVGDQIDFGARGIEPGFQRRKVLHAIAQELDGIARDKSVHLRGS
jgi:hypothetical protein